MTEFLQNHWKKIVGGCGCMIVILLTIIVCAGGVYLLWPETTPTEALETPAPTNTPTEEETTVSEASVTPVTPSDCVPCKVTEPEPTPTIKEATAWEGDNLGPEKSLPAVIENKFGAIAEIWDGGSYCALVQILPGETWDGSDYRGAYWEGLSPNAVHDRFNHHRQEYLADNSNCHVLESSSLVP